MLADCRHDRQVLDKMVFTAFMFVVTILSAIFTTVLELPREESWRQSFASFSEGSEKLQIAGYLTLVQCAPERRVTLSLSISGLIWSKAEILRIQPSVFKNSATFSLPPLSTGWPSQSSSTSKS